MTVATNPRRNDIAAAPPAKHSAEATSGGVESFQPMSEVRGAPFQNTHGLKDSNSVTDLSLSSSNHSCAPEDEELPVEEEQIMPGDWSVCENDDSDSDVAGLEQSIKVAVRLRPLNEQESRSQAVGCKSRSTTLSFRNKRSKDEESMAWALSPGSFGEGSCDSESCTISQKNARKVDGKSHFSFDSIFEGQASTQRVYETTVRPIVRGVTQGRHGTVFAYGQTGSGKSFTMQGDHDDRSVEGVIHMAARDIFNSVANSSLTRDFVVTVSYIEIYNETVRDLLGIPKPSTEKQRRNQAGSHATSTGMGTRHMELPKLRVQEDATHGVHINCVEAEAANVSAVLDLLNQGNQNRAMSATDMNKRSSRSHAIFRLHVRSRPRKSRERVREGPNSSSDEDSISHEIVRTATLNLVDLAGSENGKQSGATGQTQREGGKINQSLLSLSQVIHSLSLPAKKRPTYINYRDSKLTRILQPHLSGNALMAILCCASPSHLYVEETKSTLRFASRAKLVPTKPVVNESIDDATMIRRLRQELKEMREKLAAVRERESLVAKSYSEAMKELQYLRQMVVAGTHTEEEALEYEAQNSSKESTSSLIPAMTYSNPPSTPSQQSETDQVVSVKHAETPSGSAMAPDTLDETLPFPEELDEITSGDPLDRSGRSHPIVPTNFCRYTQRRVAAISSESSNDGENQDFPSDEILPSEVVVLTEFASDAIDPKEPTDSVVENDRRVTFLQDRLETTEDLVESLMLDLERARKCIHQLVFSGEDLKTKIKKLERKLKEANQRRDGLHQDQYILLKNTMYASLFFFFFQSHELFLASSMFVWLVLEVVA